jgi:hypothetical protein
LTDASVLLLGRDLAPAHAEAALVVGQVREVVRDRRRHVAHDGEHRALGRLADRRVRALGGAREGGADEHRVDELAGAGGQLLGGAADELREDDAAVAAGAEQRGACDGLDDLVAPDLVDRAVNVHGQAVQLAEDGIERERHVVARVAVGDREHVQVVDLLPARLQVGERALHGHAEADETGVGHETTVSARAAGATRWRADGAGGEAAGRPGSDGLADLAGLQAARADVHAPGCRTDEDADLLQVRVEAPLRRAHRVAAVLTESGTAPTAVTDLRHSAAQCSGTAADGAVRVQPTTQNSGLSPGRARVPAV